MRKQGDFRHIRPTVFTSFVVTWIPTSLQRSFLHTWTLVWSTSTSPTTSWTKTESNPSRFSARTAPWWNCVWITTSWSRFHQASVRWATCTSSDSTTTRSGSYQRLFRGKKLTLKVLKSKLCFPGVFLRRASVIQTRTGTPTWWSWDWKTTILTAKPSHLQLFPVFTPPLASS